MQYGYTVYMMYSVLVIVASFMIGYAFKPIQEGQVGAISLVIATIGSCIATLGAIHYLERKIPKIKRLIYAKIAYKVKSQST